MTNKMVGPDFELPYIVPNNNVRVECPIAIVDRSSRQSWTAKV